MTDTEASPSGGDYREDLADLAEYEFRAAQTLCADCAEYHGLWGYGRLAGINNGVAMDADIMAPALRRLAFRGARILIAGAADAGLLSLVAEATGDAKPDITIADRCETPLAVCRHYAQAHGLAIATLRTELADGPLEGRYDLILAHNLLLFIPAPVRSALLRNLAQALSDKGRLMLVVGMASPQQGGTARAQYRDHAGLLEALRLRGIPLPEEESEFRRRIASLAEAWRARRAIILDRSAIETSLSAAGLMLVETIEHSRRRTLAGEDEAAPVPTCAFIASAST